MINIPPVVSAADTVHVGGQIDCEAVMEELDELLASLSLVVQSPVATGVETHAIPAPSTAEQGSAASAADYARAPTVPGSMAPALVVPSIPPLLPSTLEQPTPVSLPAGRPSEDPCGANSDVHPGCP